MTKYGGGQDFANLSDVSMAFSKEDCCYFGGGMAAAGLLLLLDVSMAALLGWTVATSDVSMAAPTPDPEDCQTCLRPIYHGAGGAVGGQVFGPFGALGPVRGHPD